MYIHKVYTWYMPGIYHVYVDLNDMHGIYMVYPWIYHVYPSVWILVYTGMVYPWIYHVYPQSIYMVYPWIYVVYHLMYIHGIYVVYRGISMEMKNKISQPASAAGLIQCAQACG